MEQGAFWEKLVWNQKLLGEAALEPEAFGRSCSGTRSLSGKLLWNQNFLEKAALEPEASGGSCSGIKRLWGKLLWHQELLEEAALESEPSGGSCSGTRSFWGKLLWNKKRFGRSCSGIRSVWGELLWNQSLASHKLQKPVTICGPQKISGLDFLAAPKIEKQGFGTPVGVKNLRLVIFGT